MKFSSQDISELVKQFENQRLSKEQWTHEAHLIMGIYYSLNFSFYESICRMKSGIILLNHAHQTANTGTGGYHETITIIWLKIIKSFIDSQDDNSIENIVNNFLVSPFSKREYLFQLYNKDLILSLQARAVNVIELCNEGQ